MSHARIEEVSDSDDAASDPSEGDIDDFAESDILMKKGGGGGGNDSRAPAIIPASAPNAPPFPPSFPGETQMKIIPSQQNQGQQQPDMSRYVDYQHLYPIYFDASRTRAEGRRVPKTLAVQNPLAGEIANACGRLRLDTLLEPGKIHPNDWANPGRVKVGMKESDSWGETGGVKNKHHLYVLVAKHLKANPTTEKSAGLRVGMGGRYMGVGGVGGGEGEDGSWPKANVPRGWKIGSLLPHYSAALTGGGVSENLVKDMIKEIGGGTGGTGGAGGMMPPGMGGMAEMLQGLTGGATGAGGGGSITGGSDGEGKRKKDKKDKKKKR